MDQNKRGRKKIYDAQKTRETILAAASANFAEFGFKGTSVDSIAAKAGYNKSLIFQYYGNKQSLYIEVLKKVDNEISDLLMQLLKTLPENSMDVLDKASLMNFIKALIESLLDFMIKHPDFMQLMNWEQAEGWRSLAQASSELAPTYLEQVQAILKKAQEAKLIRSNIDVTIIFLLIQQISWSVPRLLLFVEAMSANNNIFNTDSLNNFKKQVIDFIISGITGTD